jgi:hypothetical protein
MGVQTKQPKAEISANAEAIAGSRLWQGVASENGSVLVARPLRFAAASVRPSNCTRDTFF